jgi:hypothetical protein
MAKMGRPKKIEGDLIHSSLYLSEGERKLLDFLADEFTAGNKTALIRIALGLFNTSAATTGLVKYPAHLRKVSFFAGVTDSFLREVGIEIPNDDQAA